MSLAIVQPTANQTPDPGQGGLAVTSPANTGHGSTVADAAAGGGSQTKTCIWTGFPAVPGGQITDVKLKLDWSENGTLGGGENQFLIQYSANGGGAWTDIINHVAIEASNNGSSSITLSTNQDLTQVRVRDKIFAQTNDAVAIGAVANIQIEVSVVDARPIVIM